MRLFLLAIAQRIGRAAISAALEQFISHAWICRFPNVVGGRAA
jgi:hypothetical protein